MNSKQIKFKDFKEFWLEESQFKDWVCTFSRENWRSQQDTYTEEISTWSQTKYEKKNHFEAQKPLGLQRMFLKLTCESSFIGDILKFRNFLIREGLSCD